MQSNEYSVELYPMAEEDLENIFSYIYDKSKEITIAENFLDTLKNAILGLSFMPTLHPPVQEPRLYEKGFRKLISGNYVIPFL